MRLVLLGPPGAGKGTQAVTLRQRLGIAHIASGDLLREHQARGTPLGQKARSYMQQGLLVPDEVVIQMILERIGQPDCARGFILDGFPRTLEQAKALDRALGAQGIDCVLYLNVSSEELVRRLGGRLTCRSCHAPYHPVTAPPRVPGRCDRCGGELYQREDDRPEAVRQRIAVYEAQTAPLVTYYREQGKLFEIDGQREAQGIAQEMLAVASGTRS
ncbi:MAG: adenylate kinase [Chloroflexi bacterium]|nr:adenylate kinase [Chloroflexota bacterium]